MSSDLKQRLTLTVNKHEFDVVVEPRDTLADVLRNSCRLTGTHVGCEHGVCGACTVIVDGEAVRSCLMFALQAEGKTVRTIEGLSETGELNILQRAFMNHHALQCGFCTPGFLMLVTAALEQNPELSRDQIQDLVSSNLCRCTGYQNILTAVSSAAEEMRASKKVDL